MQSSQDTRKKLPKIIFGDAHDDPYAKVILIKLLPKLKELGYACYYAESSLTSKAQIDAIDNYSSQFKALEKIFTENGYDIYQLIDQSIYFEGFTPGKYDELQKKIWFLPANEQRKQLFLSLDKMGILYKPIDLDLDIRDMNLQYIEFRARDAEMSKAYLAESKPVFGEVGIHHLLGFQNHFISALGIEEAKKQFLFFHINNELGFVPDDSLHEIISDTSLVTFLNTDPNEVMDSLPLGIKRFDPFKMNADQICAQLLDTITKHMEQSYSAESKVTMHLPTSNEVSAESKAPAETPTETSDLTRVSTCQSSLFSHSTSQPQETVPLTQKKEDSSFQDEFYRHYRPNLEELQDWNPRGIITKEFAISYAEKHTESAVANALREMKIIFKDQPPSPPINKLTG